MKELIKETAVYIICACVFFMASMRCLYGAVVQDQYVLYLPGFAFLFLYFIVAFTGLKKAIEIDVRIYGSQRVPEDSTESG